MVFLTLVIGVSNVCLGYALAVYLGYGPPGLPETWEALTMEPSVGRLPKDHGPIEQPDLGTDPQETAP